MRLRAWMLLHCRSSIECCAWKKSGEFWLALTMRRASYIKCPIPWHLRPLLLESYRLEHRPLLSFQPHNENDAGTVPSNPSPASRGLVSKRLYLRPERAEASGGTAQLDPALLKLRRKVSATCSFRNRGRMEWRLHGRLRRSESKATGEWPHAAVQDTARV
jgi:hypothetical protein